jgi:hypothetical protein
LRPKTEIEIKCKIEIKIEIEEINIEEKIGIVIEDSIQGRD